MWPRLEVHVRAGGWDRQGAGAAGAAVSCCVFRVLLCINCLYVPWHKCIIIFIITIIVVTFKFVKSCDSVFKLLELSCFSMNVHELMCHIEVRVSYLFFSSYSTPWKMNREEKFFQSCAAFSNIQYSKTLLQYGSTGCILKCPWTRNLTLNFSWWLFHRRCESRYVNVWVNVANVAFTMRTLFMQSEWPKHNC